MTNYERIKNMTIEEMAKMILHGNATFCTMFESDCIYGWHDSHCTVHARQWLESEADKNDEL